MIRPDNVYANFKVGDLVTPAEGTGEAVLIEHISVTDDVIRYRWLKYGEVYEKDCFAFTCRYMHFVDM